jgi:hypothetical protein
VALIVCNMMCTSYTADVIDLVIMTPLCVDTLDCVCDGGQHADD